MHFSLLVAAAAALLAVTGCHSAYIETTVINHTPTAIPLIEVDYPSASFGTQNLAPGASFHYRFKILGNGPTKLIYTDASHKDHTFPGPDLKEGDEGYLIIDLTTPTPTWQFKPKPKN